MIEIVGAIIAVAYLIPGQDDSFKTREPCRRKEQREGNPQNCIAHSVQHNTP
jgi:hypothetical protein